MKTRNASIVTLALASTLFAGAAHAQSSGLHHAQTGALLSFANGEVKVLYAALTDRQFDLELTERLIGELSRAVADAKRSTDRSTDLLDEKQEKLRPNLEKVRAALVSAQKQVDLLKADVEGQVKPFLAQLENDERDEREGEPEPVPEPDWNTLKGHAGWIAVDLATAIKLHGRLNKKIKVPRLRTPPKPKGER